MYSPSLASKKKGIKGFPAVKSNSEKKLHIEGINNK
jgi:hypothetical protein